jgi:hypothetical protein
MKVFGSRSFAETDGAVNRAAPCRILKFIISSFAASRVMIARQI